MTKKKNKEFYKRRRQSSRFDVDRARFYAAEALLALKFLHKKGIIYR
jgi:serine/threonine protein kinase